MSGGNLSLSGIDDGAAFDFGRTSADYARFRDIYPPSFFERLAALGVGVAGQRALDVGTGTGVLPHGMARFGARWTGVDISPEQVAEARRLAADAGMADAAFVVGRAESLPFPNGGFDVATACQCHWYFNAPRAAAEFRRVLAPGGRLALMQMEWMAGDDPVAAASEALALRFNPGWSGAGARRGPLHFDPAFLDGFSVEIQEDWPIEVPFTRETWHGRMRTCRGVGASLSPDMLAAWDAAHRALLARIAAPRFVVRHHAALVVLKRRNKVVRSCVSTGVGAVAAPLGKSRRESRDKERK